jgi:C4-dicarboxylate transporter
MLEALDKAEAQVLYDPTVVNNIVGGEARPLTLLETPLDIAVYVIICILSTCVPSALKSGILVL